MNITFQGELPTYTGVFEVDLTPSQLESLFGTKLLGFSVGRGSGGLKGLITHSQ